MGRTLAAAGLAVLALTGPAAAQTTGKNPSHEDILRGFDAAAFWASREDVAYGGTYNPTGLVIKWTRDILYRTDGFTYDAGAMKQAVAVLHRQAEIAGVKVREAPAAEEANFTIVFRNVANFSLQGRKASCYMQPKFDERSGRMISAVLQINLAYPGGVDRCIIHEILHGFGLLNHPHKLDSVLSYYTTKYIHDLSEADIVMLQTLYDPRLKPGTRRLKALLQADAIIEEKRRALNPLAPPRTDTTNVLRDALADLEQAAGHGNVKAMLHLSQAYRLGIVAAKNPGLADAWLDRIAERNDIPARFELAYALAGGHYGTKDETRAAALYRINAIAGDNAAQNNLAILLRDGKGVSANKAEALFWFTIAARAGNGLAEGNRGKLIGTLTEDQRAEAEQKAAAWKPGTETAK